MSIFNATLLWHPYNLHLHIFMYTKTNTYIHSVREEWNVVLVSECSTIYVDIYIRCCTWHTVENCFGEFTSFLRSIYFHFSRFLSGIWCGDVEMPSLERRWRRRIHPADDVQPQIQLFGFSSIILPASFLTRCMHLLRVLHKPWDAHSRTHQWHIWRIPLLTCSIGSTG